MTISSNICRASAKEQTAARHLQERISQISGVEVLVSAALASQPPATLIVIGSLSAATMPKAVLAKLSDDDRSFLTRGGRTDQDYVIRSAAIDGRQMAILCGVAPQGALYAMMHRRYMELTGATEADLGQIVWRSAAGRRATPTP